MCAEPGSWCRRRWWTRRPSSRTASGPTSPVVCCYLYIVLSYCYMMLFLLLLFYMCVVLIVDITLLLVCLCAHYLFVLSCFPWLRLDRRALLFVYLHVWFALLALILVYVCCFNYASCFSCLTCPVVLPMWLCVTVWYYVVNCMFMCSLFVCVICVSLLFDRRVLLSRQRAAELGGKRTWYYYKTKMLRLNQHTRMLLLCLYSLSLLYMCIYIYNVYYIYIYV